jgi:hypothetical protein
VVVDGQRDTTQHVIGDHPQVRDAEQHVGWVLVEPGGELTTRPYDGNALLVGKVTSYRTGRRQQHGDEVVPLRNLDALRNQRLIANEGATPDSPVASPNR